jgi:hypothetical protein
MTYVDSNMTFMCLREDEGGSVPFGAVAHRPKAGCPEVVAPSFAAFVKKRADQLEAGVIVWHFNREAMDPPDQWGGDPAYYTLQDPHRWDREEDENEDADENHDADGSEGEDQEVEAMQGDEGDE